MSSRSNIVNVFKRQSCHRARFTEICKYACPIFDAGSHLMLFKTQSKYVLYLYLRRKTLTVSYGLFFWHSFLLLANKYVLLINPFIIILFNIFFTNVYIYIICYNIILWTLYRRNAMEQHLMYTQLCVHDVMYTQLYSTPKNDHI